MRNMAAIKFLSELARSWGGDIALVSAKEFEALGCKESLDGWTQPPEPGHALQYATKRIVANKMQACAGTIIHEMGHAFVDPNAPDDADEWEWFGWEVCLARKVDCYRRWSRSTQHYFVGHTESGAKMNTSWRRLTSGQKLTVVKNRVDHAISIGIVDPNKNPLSMR